MLKERTGAHPKLLDLIFYCLETWLPRIDYAAVGGLPIESNDISRLVAHNYLKPIDQFFLGQGVEYLRFVDDTVIFVESLQAARQIQVDHAAKLSEYGLDPNLAKTQIVTAEEYERDRHRDVNHELADLQEDFDSASFEVLVEEWYGLDDKRTPGWLQVARRIYTLGRRKQSDALRTRVVRDLQRTPELASHALRYLMLFEVSENEFGEVKELWLRSSLDTRQLVLVGEFLGDARFDFDASKAVADFAVWRSRYRDERAGAGYAQALLLLLLHKHGSRKQREKVAKWGNIGHFEDEQFLHHFLYVFFCTGELDAALFRQLRPLANSDLELTLRFCKEAKSGDLEEWQEVLWKTVQPAGNHRTITARYLPLLRLMLSCEKKKNENEAWLERVLKPNAGTKPLEDRVILEFLKVELHRQVA